MMKKAISVLLTFSLLLSGAAGLSFIIKPKENGRRVLPFFHLYRKKNYIYHYLSLFIMSGTAPSPSAV